MPLTTLERKITVADRRILAIASAKEDGARCVYKPDGTIICEAWGKEPKVSMAVGERELPLVESHPSVHYPEALKVKGGEPATDPRFKHLTGVAKKAWIEPHPVGRTSRHRGMLFKARNGHVSFS